MNGRSQESKGLTYQRKDEQITLPSLSRSSSSMNPFQQGAQTPRSMYNGFNPVMVQAPLRFQQNSFGTQSPRTLNGNTINLYPSRTLQSICRNGEESSSLFHYKTKENEDLRIRKRHFNTMILSPSENIFSLPNIKVHPSSMSAIETERKTEMTDFDEDADEFSNSLPKSILKKDDQAKYSSSESQESVPSSISSLSRGKHKRVTFAF